LASPSYPATFQATVSHRDATRPLQRSMRIIGALAILAMGALHLQQYLDAEYQAIPTIGTLFVLNFAGAVVIGLVLLAPTERISERLGNRAVGLAAVLGAGMAATSIAFLLISEQTPLFGFMEDGYRTPIVVALISEAVAVLALAGYLVSALAAGRR
jgi:Na+/glutamate symporter